MIERLVKMNKRLFVLLVAAVAFATPLMADEETVGGYTWTYGIDGKAAWIDNITPSPIGAVTIPSVLGGKPVTRIEDSAFSGCTNMTSVAIPGSVTNIGSSAFYSCSSLTNVAIPGSVKKIDSSTFRNCSNLTSVVIPDGVGSIGGSAFYGCSSLTNVAIPSSVTKIGTSAFRDCSNLTSVAIPDGVQKITGSAFKGCSGLTSVIIPTSVTRIEASAFYGCSALTNVTIPEGVKRIRDSTFCNCGGLTSLVIPSSVTNISSSAFKKCSALKSVAIPQCVCSSKMKTIFSAAYQSITNVVIADGVTEIGSSAFSGCSSLTSIAIPDSVTSIGDGVFSGCNDLIFDTTTLPGVKLVDDWAVGYTASLPKELDLTGVRGIGGKAFFDCDELVSVTIPAGVTSIGDSAFYGCNGLTSVTIPASVTSIGDSAFYGCNSLMSIAIPDSVTSIGSCAFFGCSSLTNMTIPGGVKTVNSSVFENCSGLTSMIIPSGVTEIGNFAFYGCSGLKNVAIPASVTSIGEKAFYGCRSLMSILFEGDKPSVGSLAFSSVGSGCTAFVTRNSVGWGVEIPGKWNGIAIAFSEDGVSYGGRLNVKFAKAQTVTGALIRYDKSSSLVGTMLVKVGRINVRKRTVKLSAVATLLVNGKAKKFTSKTVTVSVGAPKRISPVTFSFMKPIGEMSFEMGASGFFTLASPYYVMEEATVGGALKGGARGTFRLEEFDLAVPGTLQDDLLPSEEPFDVVGSRWKFAKAAVVKWAKDRKTRVFGRVVDESKGKTNRSGLKLAYAAKKGIFKGSFKAYSLQDAFGGKKKLKKYKVDVIGFVVDGVGTGEASCKRPAGGPWAVTVE